MTLAVYTQPSKRHWRCFPSLIDILPIDSEKSEWDLYAEGLVPLSKYFDGRFSNGYVWPELLSAPAFLNNPKLRSGEKNTLQLLNLSEGGSTIRSFSKRLNPILHILTNLDKQIKRISKKDDDANHSDLFILELGANDYMIDNNNPEKKMVNYALSLSRSSKKKKSSFSYVLIHQASMIFLFHKKQIKAG
ncbi:SGNH/GDSL hydrolase family protein [Endozoicomonas sp. YOMI1]|uniref:SGNH/GDSL hydrolase family protein n=1 Tax=Endozoicomonas sp. YOMI1 TaxID=2828739 RepID=UPI0021497E6F|nr:SGNH/GDSL hydrolase family protein [Endozoicomonas sp. YOMI1]